MSVAKVLVHSIGPNGVYAEVIEARSGKRTGEKLKVRYYDANDGGDIVRWVDRSEVAIMSGDFPDTTKEEDVGSVKNSVDREDIDGLLDSIRQEYRDMLEVQADLRHGEPLGDVARDRIVTALEKIVATCAAAAQDLRQLDVIPHWKTKAFRERIAQDPDLFQDAAREDEAGGWH
tara:strand:+ start:1609 stop:2133 length:525 start_codon:yes stop_codon:yes gene_type:complete